MFAPGERHHGLFLRTEVHRRIFGFKKRNQFPALRGIFYFPLNRHYALWKYFAWIIEKTIERFFSPYDFRIP